MNDPIDRQAAIDAIDKIFPADPMRNDYTQGITCGAALATEYIKQLPSAQPERCEDCGNFNKTRLLIPQPDIIVCADCKHWICHDRRCGYWNHRVKPLEWCCHAERRTDDKTNKGSSC